MLSKIAGAALLLASCDAYKMFAVCDNGITNHNAVDDYDFNFRLRQKTRWILRDKWHFQVYGSALFTEGTEYDIIVTDGYDHTADCSAFDIANSQGKIGEIMDPDELGGYIPIEESPEIQDFSLYLENDNSQNAAYLVGKTVTLVEAGVNTPLACCTLVKGAF